MANFYDTWLGFWEEGNATKAAARAVIHEEELEWVETDQDFRVALLAAPENGFATWGSEYIISEIPPGWHSGKHEHGEEAIYIVEGEGFSIVNGVKYEWGKDSCLWMPFGSQHQHFNTGTTTVRYFSAMALHIEHWMGMGKLDQISLKGPTDNYEDAEVSASGFDVLNRRIAFRRDEQEEVTLDELDPNDVEEISGEPMTIRMRVVAERPVADFAFGVSIFSSEGVCCYGTNTHLEELEPTRLDGAGEVAFVVDRLDLVAGTYKLDVAVHKRDGFSYDYHRLLYTFRVKSDTRDVGIYRPRHAWRFSGNIRFNRPR